jgi:hypothetical protein
MTEPKKPRGRKPAVQAPTIEGRRLEIVYRNPETLTADPRNARTHSPEQIEQLRASIREFGFTNPVLLRPNGMIGAGHGRVEAAKAEGLDSIPTCTIEGLTDDQWRAYVIADNRLALNAGWDMDILAEELAALGQMEIDLGTIGFGADDLAAIFATDQEPDPEATDSGKSGAGSLAERFGIPPFSVLNAREGWWQDRKRAWLALGIASEVGRGENLLKMSDTMLEPDPEKRAAMQAARTAKNGGGAGTLGAIAPNQDTIMNRTGKYAGKGKARV